MNLQSLEARGLAGEKLSWANGVSLPRTLNFFLPRANWCDLEASLISATLLLRQRSTAPRASARQPQFLSRLF